MKRPMLVFLVLMRAATAMSAEPNTLPAAEQAEGWALLFDGRSLDGWKASEAAGSFRVEDGVIVAEGPRSHLYYVGPVEGGEFKDFEFSAEVKTFPGANSGVYFHTRWQETGWPAAGYEVQINNSDPPGLAPGGNPSRSGSLWGVADSREATVPDGQWFTLRIRVEGKRIVTAINDQVVVDYTEPLVLVRPEHLAGKALSSGAFALQIGDPASRVQFRSIKVRPMNKAASRGSTVPAEKGDSSFKTAGAPEMTKPEGASVGSIVVGAGRNPDGSLANPGQPLPENLPRISADIELRDLPAGEPVQVWVEQGENRTEPMDAVVEGQGSGTMPFDLHLGDAAFPPGRYTLVVMLGETKRFTQDFEIGGIQFRQIVHLDYDLSYEIPRHWEQAAGRGEFLVSPRNDHPDAGLAWAKIRVIANAPGESETQIEAALRGLIASLPDAEFDGNAAEIVRNAGASLREEAAPPGINFRFREGTGGAKWRGRMVVGRPVDKNAPYHTIFTMACREDRWLDFVPVFARILAGNGTAFAP